jgi:hypothetical protein
MKFTLSILIVLLLSLSARAGTITSAASAQSVINVGGSVSFAAGTYTFTAPLTIPSGETLSTSGAVLNFNIAPTDYALYIAGNAANVTITGLTINSTGRLIKLMDGSGYSNITITKNSFKYAGTFGIYNSVPVNGLSVNYNLFHDSQGTDRAGYFFGTLAGNFSENEFTNVNAGFQLNLPGPGWKFNSNYASQIHAKLLETGMTYCPSFEAGNNVFVDPYLPDDNTMALSIVAVVSAQTSGWAGSIHDNYLDVTPANGIYGGTPTGTTLEAGAFTVDISNNVICGAKSNGLITVMTPGATGSGNRTFGPYTPAVTGEGGPAGGGTNIKVGATAAAYSQRPAPPANTFAGPSPSTTVVTPVVTAPPVASSTTTPISGLTATPSTSTVALAWTGALANITIHTFTPADDCGTVTIAGPATSATLNNLNAGWGYSCVISGKNASGEACSGSVTFTTTGKSANGTKATVAMLAATVVNTSTETIHRETMSDGTVVTVSDVTTTP